MYPLLVVTKNGNFGEEVFIQPPLGDGGLHEDPPVRVPVDAPERGAGPGQHGGRPRGPVDQRQLAEAAALGDGGDGLPVYHHLYLALDNKNA